MKINKVLWYDNDDKIANMYNDLKSKINGELNFHRSLKHFLEIVDPQVSKGIALEKICEYYKIDKKEVIAIGDGENDISMIKYAGLGVAMDNADEIVKQNADFITLSNENDGVVHDINKFIKT